MSPTLDVCQYAEDPASCEAAQASLTAAALPTGISATTILIGAGVFVFVILLASMGGRR